MMYLRYLVPTSITAMAIACGVIAIVQSIDGRPADASWWILYATIFDRMDGLAARALNASSRFGVWIDSLSDFIAFGVAPAFLVLGTAPSEANLVLVYAAMTAYSFGAAIRLIRFSMQEASSEFRGVPSTLAGGSFAAGVLSALRHGVSGVTGTYVFCGVLVALGIAMNTPWIRYGKVGGLTTRWLNLFGLCLVGTCALFIVIGICPEFVFGSSLAVMGLAPLVASYEGRVRRKE